VVTVPGASFEDSRSRGLLTLKILFLACMAPVVESVEMAAVAAVACGPCSHENCCCRR